MKAAFLPDRGVVKVSGEDARNFLNGLITTDLTRLEPGKGRFGALLTPQGKIVADFLIAEAPASQTPAGQGGGGILIDCPRALAADLSKKLGFYKLRAKVTVDNLSDSLGVIAAWDGELAMKPDLTLFRSTGPTARLAHFRGRDRGGGHRQADRRRSRRQRRV